MNIDSPSLLYLHDVIDNIPVQIGEHVRQGLDNVFMFSTLDATRLGVFGTSLACGSVLGVEYAGEFLLRGGSTAMGGVRALVLGEPTVLAACARGLIDVWGEAGKGDTGLRCRNGLEAVLGNRGT